jgi:hypothetical protein
MVRQFNTADRVFAELDSVRQLCWLAGVKIYRRQPRFMKKRTATMMMIAMTATSTQFVNVMFYSKVSLS